MFQQKNCIHNGLDYQTYEKDKTIFVDFKMLGSMGAN